MNCSDSPLTRVFRAHLSDCWLPHFYRFNLIICYWVSEDFHVFLKHFTKSDYIQESEPHLRMSIRFTRVILSARFTFLDKVPAIFLYMSFFSFTHAWEKGNKTFPQIEQKLWKSKCWCFFFFSSHCKLVAGDRKHIPEVSE